MKNTATSRVGWSGLVRSRRALHVGIIFVLSLVVIAPLAIMLVAVFRPAGMLPLEAGPFTTDNLLVVATTPGLLHILENTAIYVVGTLALGLLIALTFALLIERADLPGGRVFYVLMFIEFALPAFVTALGWILLAGPRSGVLNVVLRTALDIEGRTGPFNIFSFPAMIFVTALGMVPGMWILLVSVMRNMNPSLEEAAWAAGLSPLRTLRRITLPLMTPGIVATVLFFSIVAVETFDVPLFIGLGAGIEVLSTRIYLLSRGSDYASLNYSLAAAFGLVSLILGIGGMFLYLRAVRQSSRFEVVSGRGYRRRRWHLGQWKYPALALVLLYFTLTLILPLGILGVASLLKFYQPPLPQNFRTLLWTTENYEMLLSYRFFGRQVVNTVVVAATTATISMLAVTFVAWVLVRLPHRLSSWVNLLSFLPHTIPGIVLALAFLLLYVSTPLYGSLALLVLAFTVRFLAFGVRLMHAAQLQIHKELEEAAVVSGLSRIRSFWRINVPLLRGAFLNGWLLFFILVARDVTMPVMLSTPKTELLGGLIYNRYHDGLFPHAAAPILVLALLIAIIVLLARRVIEQEFNLN